jgi:hypothetical protein
MVDHAAEWHIRAAPSGGAEPDLLEEVAWWQSDDPCRPLFAAVACIRAAAQPGGHARAPGMPGT